MPVNKPILVRSARKHRLYASQYFAFGHKVAKRGDAEAGEIVEAVVIIRPVSDAGGYCSRTLSDAI